MSKRLALSIGAAMLCMMVIAVLSLVLANPVSATTNWDKSSLAVTGQCLQGGGESFTVTNSGSGNMTGTSSWELYVNGSLVQTGTIPALAVGGSATFSFNYGGTVEFRAYQRPGHPGLGYAKVVVHCQGVTPTSTSTSTNTPTATATNTSTNTPTGTATATSTPPNTNVPPTGTATATSTPPTETEVPPTQTRIPPTQTHVPTLPPPDPHTVCPIPGSEGWPRDNSLLLENKLPLSWDTLRGVFTISPYNPSEFSLGSELWVYRFGNRWAKLIVTDRGCPDPVPSTPAPKKPFVAGKPGFGEAAPDALDAEKMSNWIQLKGWAKTQIVIKPVGAQWGINQVAGFTGFSGIYGLHASNLMGQPMIGATLAKQKAGDIIVVALNGRKTAYRVTSTKFLPVGTIGSQQIALQKQDNNIVLYSCYGLVQGRYTQYIVVIAERVTQSPILF